MVRSSFVSLVVVFVLCYVFPAKVSGHIQQNLKIQDLESKIDGLSFFLTVFCDDVEDDDCVDAIDAVDSVSQAGVLFTGLETAIITQEELFKKYGIEIYPSIVFFKKGDPIFYTDTTMDLDSLAMWMEHHRLSQVITLNDSTFEHDTQATSGSTTGDWYIMFYELSCSHLLGTWEHVATRLHGNKVVAKIELSSNPVTKRRFGFKNCVTVAFFKQGKMHVYKDDLTKFERLSLFSQSGYNDVEAENIPAESGFNVLDAVTSVWTSFAGRVIVIGGGLLTVFLVIITVVLTSRKPKAKAE